MKMTSRGFKALFLLAICMLSFVGGFVSNPFFAPPAHNFGVQYDAERQLNSGSFKLSDKSLKLIVKDDSLSVLMDGIMMTYEGQLSYVAIEPTIFRFRGTSPANVKLENHTEVSRTVRVRMQAKHMLVDMDLPLAKAGEKEDMFPLSYPGDDEEWIITVEKGGFEINNDSLPAGNLEL